MNPDKITEEQVNELIENFNNEDELYKLSSATVTVVDVDNNTGAPVQEESEDEDAQVQDDHGCAGSGAGRLRGREAASAEGHERCPLAPGPDHGIRVRSSRPNSRTGNVCSLFQY